MSDNVDYSQRTADDEDDPYLEQAEDMVRDLEKRPDFKHLGIFADPEKRRQYVEDQADALRGSSGKKPMPKQTQPEDEEKPWSSDRFWGSDEPGKVMPKKL